MKTHALLRIVTAIITAIGTSLFAITADAHGDHAPPDPDMTVENRIEAVETDFGRMGAAKEVTRTVDVSMGDAMRFEPSSLAFTRGDTIRIHLHNSGSVDHEFILGTDGEIRDHADMMKRFPDMVHDEPSSKRLRAGQSAEILWQFTKAGHFVFACLIPGHAEAGMRGTIDVTDTVHDTTRSNTTTPRLRVPDITTAAPTKTTPAPGI